jgi:AraC-like DNA-binding protein
MEQVLFTKVPGPPGLELKSVYRSTRLWTRFNLNYAFCAILDANSSWRYRRETHAATAGTVVLMEPGESHVTAAAPRPASFRTLFVTPALMDQLRDELGWAQLPHLSAPFTRDPRVWQALTRFDGLLDVPHSQLERDSRLVVAIRAILRSGAESVPSERTIYWQPAPVQRVRAVLEERYAEELSLHALAAAAKLSRFHLLRLFRLHTGMAPHAFQLQLRLARAKELLKLSVPLGEIALRVGFFDQSHFSRYFSRTFGISPGRYALAMHR